MNDYMRGMENGAKHIHMILSNFKEELLNKDNSISATQFSDWCLGYIDDYLASMKNESEIK